MVTMGKWFRQRNNLEKCLLLFSCILIFILLILIIVIAVSQGGGDAPGGDGPTCWTKQCIKTAGQMLSKMSEDINPCSNFYDYACGSYSILPGSVKSIDRTAKDLVYHSIHNILSDSNSRMFSDVPEINHIKMLYKSCMDFEGVKKPKDTLNLLMTKLRVGPWPVTDPYYNAFSENLSLEERLVGLLFVGIPIAYKIDIIPDFNKNGSFIAKLSPGGPHISRYLNQKYLDVRQDSELKTHLKSTLLHLEAKDALATSAVNDILSTDNKFAAIEQETTVDCDVTDTIFTDDESLTELMNYFEEASASITTLFNDIRKAAGLSEPFTVKIYCKEKIKEYIDYLKDIDEKTVFNYLGWRFFATFLPHFMPSIPRQPIINGGGYTRAQECTKLLEQPASLSLIQALNLKLVQNATIEKARKITSEIKTNMDSKFSNVYWLDSEEKSTTQQQLKSVEINLPFKKKHSESGSAVLRSFEVKPENYTFNIINLHYQNFVQNLRKLNPTHKHISGSKDMSLTTRFQLSDDDSYINIPFDRIQEPYFTTNAPDWINFGGLGAFTARELFKSLTKHNLGISDEYESTLWDIWYRDASGCFLNEVASSFGLINGNELIKRKWIKELFLDTSSLEIAYESSIRDSTSKKKLPGFSQNEEQLFFLAYTQTFCASQNDELHYQYIPIKERINAVVSNSKSFNKAFSCAAKTTCEIWS